MEIKKTESITWELAPVSINCFACNRTPATYKITIGNDYFSGTFPACDSCKNLDAQSFYDRIANTKG